MRGFLGAELAAFMIAAFLMTAMQPIHAFGQEAMVEQLAAVKNMSARNAMPFSGNVKTMKYHNDGCKFYDCRDCTKFFRTREAAKKAGYKACGKCGG